MMYSRIFFCFLKRSISNFILYPNVLSYVSSDRSYAAVLLAWIFVIVLSLTFFDLRFDFIVILFCAKCKFDFDFL